MGQQVARLAEEEAEQAAAIAAAASPPKQVCGHDVICVLWAHLLLTRAYPDVYNAFVMSSSFHLKLCAFGYVNLIQMARTDLLQL